MKTKEIKIDEIYKELEAWNLDIITTDEISKKIVDYYNSKDGYYVSKGDGYHIVTMKAFKYMNMIHFWNKDELEKVKSSAKTEEYGLPVELIAAKVDEFDIVLQFYIAYKTCIEYGLDDCFAYNKTTKKHCIIVWDGIDKNFEERINKILQLNCVENYVVVSFDELVELMSKLKELQNNKYFKVINK